MMPMPARGLIYPGTPGTARSWTSPSSRLAFDFSQRLQCDVQSPRLHRPYALFFHSLLNSTHPSKLGRVLLVLQDGRAIVVAYLFLPDFPPPLL